VIQPRAAVTVSKVPQANLPKFWEKGRSLYATDGAQLPHRCVKCNARSPVLMIHEQLAWYPKWSLLVPFLPLLLRRKIHITYSICQDDLQKRRSALVGCYAVVMIGALLATLGHLRGVTPILLAGLASFIGGLLGLIMTYPILRVRRIEDDGVATLAGAHLDFICSLYRRAHSDPSSLQATPQDAEPDTKV
jgi:hypothetical protein